MCGKFNKLHGHIELLAIKSKERMACNYLNQVYKVKVLRGE